MTRESSADRVLAALNAGAQGYVVKARAGTDLLATVEAIIEGSNFVSGSLRYPGLIEGSRDSL